MNIIIIGDGGHSKVIQDMINRGKQYVLYAVLDDKYDTKIIENGMIRAPLSAIFQLMDENIRVVVAIGDNNIRKKIIEKLKLPVDRYATIIDPATTISSSAVIGHGTVVMPNSVINANVEVGDHCIINTGAIIEHDNTIQSFVHVSPHATLTGNVMIEEGVHIGAAATVIPNTAINKWSVIGAGSVVIRTIPSHSTAVGNPARLIKTAHEIEQLG